MKNVAAFFLFYLAVQTFALANSPGRGPSVEPMVEVDIESPERTKKNDGYNFDRQIATNTTQVKQKARVPANITTKSTTATPYSYIGPFIFLITLPIALWIMVSKKFKSHTSENQVGYYGKTHQFQPRRSEYESSDDDDDIDYPKAS